LTTNKEELEPLRVCRREHKSGLDTPEYLTMKKASDFFKVSLMRLSDTSLNTNPNFFMILYC